MTVPDSTTGRERASGNAGQHRWSGPQAVGSIPGARRPSGRVLAGGRVLCLLFVAAGAPTPPYASTGPNRGSRRPR